MSVKKCRRDTMILLSTSAIKSAFAECRREIERLTSYQIFKKFELDRTSTLRGGLLEKRGDFFQRALQFLQKNKLKPEIFNDKKSL